MFDRKAHKLAKQFTVREKLPRESLAKMEPVRYKSSDGLEIPAYLTLPKGVPGKEPALRSSSLMAGRGAEMSGATTATRSSLPIAAMPC